ncbi:MAG: hypothetical protein CME35_01270 [Gramella sp.]|nr:hypothetical protein [Christiangramia sp.]MAY34451.1 hypothetical protein [Rhodovulum sp.]|tara:strand:+ start:136 stop:354 length:219 start_codon:yes stop_codon:yes gene_type:complete
MARNPAITQIYILEEQIKQLQDTVKVLKKGLQDSGASKGPARKGIKESIKQDVERQLARRRINQMKKATGGR